MCFVETGSQSEDGRFHHTASPGPRQDEASGNEIVEQNQGTLSFEMIEFFTSQNKVLHFLNCRLKFQPYSNPILTGEGGLNSPPPPPSP